jgi:putative transposase
MARTRLAKSVGDTGLGQLRRQLTYQAEWYGRELMVINRWYPSTKTCSCCGHEMESIALSVRAWTCPVCAVAHDRDTNATRNILAVAVGEQR